MLFHQNWLDFYVYFMFRYFCNKKYYSKDQHLIPIGLGFFFFWSLVHIFIGNIVPSLTSSFKLHQIFSSHKSCFFSFVCFPDR